MEIVPIQVKAPVWLIWYLPPGSFFIHASAQFLCVYSGFDYMTCLGLKNIKKQD